MEDKLIFYSSSKDNEIGKNKNEFINNPDKYFYVYDSNSMLFKM
jgi:hypothetical protein